jgi:acetyl esterase/lipase
MNILARRIPNLALAGAVTMALSIVQTAAAQAAATAPGGTIKPDKTVVVQSFDLPASIYVSAEARRAMPTTPVDPEAQMRQMLAAGKIPEVRPKMAQYMAPQIDRIKALYPVQTRDAVIDGVPAIYVTPAGGVPKANAAKILLNLPGGGFIMGMAPGTGMIESIPLAAIAKVQIVSVTYRQAPEARYPAATQDVVKVYRALLKTHKPQDIAVFGCSAGGLLTAEAVAAFQKEGLPMPSSVGIFCASADARWAGDSRAFARPFQGLAPQDRNLGYFEGANLADPQVSPVIAPSVLKSFPPTLLITATRAMEMSAAVNTHRELTKAGVAADLHVWDGLGHAFFYDPNLPESREAFDVMANFFAKYLKLAR